MVTETSRTMSAFEWELYHPEQGVKRADERQFVAPITPTRVVFDETKNRKHTWTPSPAVLSPASCVDEQGSVQHGVGTVPLYEDDERVCDSDEVNPEPAVATMVDEDVELSVSDGENGEPAQLDAEDDGPSAELASEPHVMDAVEALSCEILRLRSEKEDADIMLSDQAYRFGQLTQHFRTQCDTIFSLLQLPEYESDASGSQIDDAGLSYDERAEELLQKQMQCIVQRLQSGVDRPATDARVKELEALSRQQQAVQIALIAEKRDLEAQLQAATREKKEEADRAHETLEAERVAHREQVSRLEDRIRGLCVPQAQALVAGSRSAESSPSSVLQTQFFTDAMRSLDHEATKVRLRFDEADSALSEQPLGKQTSETALEHVLRGRALRQSEIGAIVKAYDSVLACVPDDGASTSDLESVFSEALMTESPGSAVRSDSVEGAKLQVIFMRRHLMQMRDLWRSELDKVHALYAKLEELTCEHQRERAAQELAHGTEKSEWDARAGDLAQQVRLLSAKLESSERMLDEKEQKESVFRDKERCLAEMEQRAESAESAGESLRHALATQKREWEAITDDLSQKAETLTREVRRLETLTRDVELQLDSKTQELMERSAANELAQRAVNEQSIAVQQLQNELLQTCTDLENWKAKARTGTQRAEKYKAKIARMHEQYEKQMQVVVAKLQELGQAGDAEYEHLRRLVACQASLAARDQRALECARAEREEFACGLERIAAHRRAEVDRLALHESAVHVSFIESLERAAQVMRNATI
ncbi:hypothetical protein FVE85_0131 [Porphyridium purpureum]|uniref:Uncharacterized protein n=1 Tax=Porphyridium purpureum TaxID=35688 RepID=A0A5J4Z015_PORPP|nr:hypothetical protein FVE85_0131 [Porphyridium purpureum]|eukprot:POR4901..scf208_2